jgi:hypothetical protein
LKKIKVLRTDPEQSQGDQMAAQQICVKMNASIKKKIFIRLFFLKYTQ